MTELRRVEWVRLVVVTTRSVLVGAVCGLVGGGLLFFVFGFVGYTGAPLSWRLRNGWRALIDPGLGKGLVVGAGIAIGLIALTALWTLWFRRFDSRRARPWLGVLSGIIVVLSNLEWLRSSAGWDWAGIATVTGISLMVAGIVWLVSPWVLRDWWVVPG